MIAPSSAALATLGTPHPQPALWASQQTDERAVDQLRAHPDLTKHYPGYSTAEISGLADRGESAYDSPLMVTQDGIVVEGRSLFQLAKLQKRKTIRCVVREMTKEQALLHIIDGSRGSKGLNDFVRILLALELEPWFKDRAKENQRLGGRGKGSSQLTEADHLDVRVEIARAAAVSVGNVSKVKKIVSDAEPELHDALRLGNVSIARGALWAKLSPAGQRRRLAEDRKRRGIFRTISLLLNKHEPTHPKLCDGLLDVQRGLRKLKCEELLYPLTDSLDRILREVDLALAPAEGGQCAA